MEVKEAIDFLERLQNPHLEWLKKHNDNIDEIISLLQQGEKYRQMWEEFKKEYSIDWNLIELGYLDIQYADQKDLEITMNKFEQKYFPKEV